MGSFFIQTFGCRCNQADSASIRDALCRGARRQADAAASADLVVINSCTVTGRTDAQVRQAVRKAHRENRRARIVVTGCYAERDPKALASLPGVELVVGTADRDRLAEILEAGDGEGPGRIVRSPLDAARECRVAAMSETGGKTRPFVKIQDGCDARCSYCVIPAVRGAGRSAPPEEVLRELAALIARGYQEIVLTGVHLGSYRRRLRPPVSLAALLARALDLPGLGRLRLSSIEPMRFERAIVELAASRPNLAPHFHVPLQSGSDRILRLMRRPYSAARFLDLLDFVRARLPDAALGTDVLVGFPGESDADFEATCELVRRSPLTYLHVFPFSAREGTAAWSMAGRVPAAAVRERCRILRENSRERSLAFRRRFVGKTLAALSLAAEEEMGEAVVLTGNYIHARVARGGLEPNRLVRVRIDEAGSDATLASVV